MLFFFVFFLLEDQIVYAPQYAENITYINAVVIIWVNHYGGFWVVLKAWGHGNKASEGGLITYLLPPSLPSPVIIYQPG